MADDYNGWKNRATWNVALWINNDQGLYELSKEFEGYGDFKDHLRECGSTETPDGVAYNDSGLDIEALDRVIQENGGE